MKRTFICLALLLCLEFIFFLKPINFIVYAKEISNKDYTAKSYFLMEHNTGKVLIENNSDKKMPVASIVKLMTICLTCEEIDNGKLKVDDKVIASSYASSMGGSQVFIEANNEYSIGDLLKSTIISSANDASVVLAETIAGSEENFVKLMNNKANELGMKNTNYVNCTGLPTANQFSTARDTAILLKEVIQHKLYHNYSTIWMDTLVHSKGRETELVNTNKLIRYFDGCDGGKTGSTSEAGYCLAATAKRNNMRLIGVVLGSENGKARFAETSKLLNYGFSNYENKLLVDSNLVLKEKCDIRLGQRNRLTVKPKDDIYVVCSRNEEKNDFEIITKFTKNIDAPIKVGECVGKIYVTKDNIVVGESEIVSIENISKINFNYNFSKVIDQWEFVSKN